MPLFRLIERLIDRDNLTPGDLEKMQRNKEKRGCKTDTVIDGDRHAANF